MRRRILSVLVLVLALVGVVVGVAMAVLLGPDNRLTTGPHDVGTDYVALVTSPEVLRWAGPTVTVTAELPDNQPVFLGLGNTVDVADFLSRTGFERVDTLDLPWRVSTTTVSGKRYVPAAPMAADWWIAQNAGQGGAQITVSLPDETTSLVVVALAGDLQDLQVSGSYFLAGGFGAGLGLGLAALALGVGMFGWLALRTVGAPAAAPRTAAPRRRPAGSAPARRPAGTAPRPRPAGGKPSRPGPPRPGGSAPARLRAAPTSGSHGGRQPRTRPTATTSRWRDAGQVAAIGCLGGVAAHATAASRGRSAGRGPKRPSRATVARRLAGGDRPAGHRVLAAARTHRDRRLQDRHHPGRRRGDLRAVRPGAQERTAPARPAAADLDRDRSGARDRLRCAPGRAPLAAHRKGRRQPEPGDPAGARPTPDVVPAVVRGRRARRGAQADQGADLHPRDVGVDLAAGGQPRDPHHRRPAGVRRRRPGRAGPGRPDDDNGLSLSPADAVTAYVGALNAASGAEENGQDDPAAAARAAKRAQDQELGGSSDLPDPGGDGAAGSSPQPAPTTGGGPGGSDDQTDPSRLIVRDSFIAQMATIARQQSSIGGVRFAQQWQAQPVEYALRTADGGALVFADLLRVDAYSLSEGTVVNWPEGSEQQAFLTGKLYSGGQLSYIHQVLLYLPPEGGKLRAIGQYGGVVDASGS